MVEQFKQYLRQPQTLAIAAPALLAIVLLMSFVHMRNTRQEARFQIQNVRDSMRYASQIKMLRDSSLGTSGRNFSGISSVQECARAAGIAEENISRGESSKPSSQPDGYLLQIAKFIDHAERNYSDLQCTQLALIPTPGAGSRDNWSATLTLSYTVK